MTDQEIGKKVRDIISRGNDAEVKKNKEGDVVIYEVRRKKAIK